MHEGAAIPAEITQADLEDDRYLKPVLDDDALILCLDDLPEASQEGAAQAGASSSSAATGGEPAVDDLLKKNAELQVQLEQLAKQFTNYRLAVQQTLDQRWQADDEMTDAQAKKAAEAAAPTAAPANKEDPDYYFESYAHNDIHETMLKDTVRTDAYRDFIYNNKHLFAGKTVLDIGCGTGILSMFCAKAGAAKVIAVDRSEIIDKARENIFRNGLSDVIVTLKGKIEDVTLPVDKVDIIVSEWMGYCLLYEAMLPSVLWARDRYLKPDGLLVPSHSSIWIAPLSDQEYIDENISFWRDVYGFDMEAMQRGIYQDCRMTVMPSDTVIGTGVPFRFLDLHTCTVEDLVFSAKWATAFSKDLDPSQKPLDGFLVWFDMFFAQTRTDTTVEPHMTAKEWTEAAGPSKEAQEGRVSFTTGPFGEPTHWRQGLFLIDKKKKQEEVQKSGGKIKEVEVGPGKPIEGQITFATAKGHARGIDIKITWGGEGSNERGVEEQIGQEWLLH